MIENKTAKVTMPENPAVSGHLQVVAKKTHPIMEVVPNKTLEDMFLLAQEASTRLFDGLDAQGTNILIQNGIPAGQTVPWFTVNVIPRFENDGLKLSWSPKEVSEEELHHFAKVLEAEVERLQNPKAKKEIPNEAPPESTEQVSEEPSEAQDDVDAEEYYLQRIP